MTQYIVDAFTNRLFSGNAAAVLPLKSWLDEDMLLQIARENNLSETAFFIPKERARYHLRWFTPEGEIELCGHATLASAFVVMHFLEPDLSEVCFETLSGVLRVRRVLEQGRELFEMDFPSYDLKQIPISPQLKKALEPLNVLEAYMGRDLLCIVEDEKALKNFTPKLDEIAKLPGLILHISARGEREFDCVSRSFAPKCGVSEDPVCGSGHCHIAPYWAKKLSKTDLKCFQASRRTGELYIKVLEDRVKMSGEAVLFATAKLNLSTLNLSKRS